ncbi:MAG TPA: aminotransferase class IV [Chitinophagaceae bacterium]|nr:aminotransferase class IV [Chitinophagaceae bacterium]
MNEQFFIFNNKFYDNDSPVISPSNRGLRYGDGLFETMKGVKGKIINEDFHFERLFSGLALLKFEIPKAFNKGFVLKKIKELCAKNKHDDVARIRLMIIRGNGGIFDPENLFPNYIIESWNLTSTGELNDNGLVIEVLPGVKKSCDNFSHLKSNNYLPYIMAGLYAKENNLNDCIVLNSFERICDSAIANIFIIKGNEIITPPLSEGCVAGTMRRWMLEKFYLQDYRVVEKKLTENDLLHANECFLTNSIYHLRWVKNFRNKNYTNSSVKKIYNHILQTI